MWWPDKRRIHRLSGLTSRSRDKGPAVERLGHVKLMLSGHKHTFKSVAEVTGAQRDAGGVADTFSVGLVKQASQMKILKQH